jgi:flagellin-specific chaperone FliS
MHPLSDNLSTLKDNELENKIQELTRKYFMTSNYEVQRQITMLLDLHKQELAQRQSKMWQNQFEKRNKDLDKLINVQ